MMKRERAGRCLRCARDRYAEHPDSPFTLRVLQERAEIHASLLRTVDLESLSVA